MAEIAALVEFDFFMSIGKMGLSQFHGELNVITEAAVATDGSHCQVRSVAGADRSCSAVLYFSTYDLNSGSWYIL